MRPAGDIRVKKVHFNRFGRNDLPTVSTQAENAWERSNYKSSSTYETGRNVTLEKKYT
jgi:hypothetical protein